MANPNAFYEVWARYKIFMSSVRMQMTIVSPNFFLVKNRFKGIAAKMDNFFEPF